MLQTQIEYPRAPILTQLQPKDKKAHHMSNVSTKYVFKKCHACKTQL